MSESRIRHAMFEALSTRMARADSRDVYLKRRAMARRLDHYGGLISGQDGHG